MAERKIETLESGVHIRLRFSMYLAAETEEALRLALREIWVNSCDELTFHNIDGSVKIELDSKKRTMSVSDNGTGIPFDKLEAAYLTANTGSNFKGRVGNLIGANGLGSKTVAHTSEVFKAISYRNGEVATLEVVDGGEQGIKKGEVAVHKNGITATGMTVFFKPLESIYKDAWIDEATLLEELHESAKFYPGIKFSLVYDGKITKIHYPKGLKLPETEAYYESESFILSLSTEQGAIKPFANRLHMPDGGNFYTHFKTQLTKEINNRIDFKITGAEIQSALSGYAAVFVTEPVFSNQQKSALGNKEVNPEITLAVKMVVDQLEQSSKWNKIIKTLQAEMRAEEAAQKAREKILKTKKDFANKKINSMSDKFIDTDYRDRQGCDLYLAEGTSACGPIKRTKPHNAATLELRGKVLNVARTDFAHVSENRELMLLAKAIGATMTETGFLLTDKAQRFGKIIIAADSDEDGGAIEALLLTFFYKYFPQLIKQGKIYGLAPKLFKLEYSGKIQFFKNEEEMQIFIKANRIKGAKIARYKGLGSYNDEEFKTQIALDSRELRRFTIKNAAHAAQAITLMENAMQSRRELVRGEFEFAEEENA